MSELPEGPWLNVGSGRVQGPTNGWTHLDGSWRAFLAGRPILARIASRVSGRKLHDWPADVHYWDVRTSFRNSANSVAVVYASHVLEHLYREQACAFLVDVLRVLRSGGICRVVVPDVHAIVQWYLEHRATRPRPEKASSDLFMELLGLRQAAAPGRGIVGTYRRWTDLDQHKWMYDEESLVELFREAGFEAPEVKGFLESVIPKSRLEQVEKADRVLDGAGICVEARK